MLPSAAQNVLLNVVGASKSLRPVSVNAGMSDMTQMSTDYTVHSHVEAKTLKHTVAENP